MKESSRYCVLYTPAQTQWKATRTLKRTLRGGDGIVFYPCAEVWSRSTKSRVIRPIMPGYVFVRSGMSAGQLHKLVRSDRWILGIYMKELGLMTESPEGETLREEEVEIEELRPEEASFLDLFLDVCEKSEESTAGHDEADSLGAPLDALFRMSYGYREEDGYVIMEGPLRGQESHIIAVNVHDRKAMLDYTIGGRKIRVGLETKPKRYWYPEDDTAPVVIQGDYEVDLEKMKRSMMTFKT